MNTTSLSFLRRLLLLILLWAGARHAPRCNAAPGDLDLSFGGTGIVTTAIGSGDAYVNSMVVQPDGRIVVVGYANNGSNFDFAVVRYNSDGSLDTGFGPAGTGKVTTDFRGYRDSASSVALQSDGKIVVAGLSDDSSGRRDVALARYNPEGSLDNTFGSGVYGPGKIVTGAIGGGSGAYAVTVQPDGRILVAGYAFTGLGEDFAVLRYNSDGTLDGTFGAGGLVTTSLRSDYALPEFATSIVLQGEKILVAGGGAVYNGNVKYFVAVVRYNANGSLDGDFTGPGGPGNGAGQVGTHNGYATGMALQPDGAVVLSGSNFQDPRQYFTLDRYTTSGAKNFGTYTGIGITNDVANSVALQSDGKIVLAGYSYNANSALKDFALVRYNDDGSLDTSFHSDGKVTTHIGSGDAYGQSIAIQSDGRILVAGYSYNGTENVFTVARYYGTEQPPIVQTGTATVAKTSAALMGTVNPNSLATTAHFEYAPDNEYGPNKIYNKVTSDQACGSGVKAIGLSAPINLLIPNTTYHFRLVATNSAAINSGKTNGNDATFTTDPDPPQAFTGDATSVTASGAILGGVVIPNGRDTDVYFEYGRTLLYENGKIGEQVISATNGLVNVSAPVMGLTPDAAYHFRLVAKNSGSPNPSNGDDVSFLAKPPPPTVVSLADATSVAAGSATVAGVVNANGVDTVATFEYSVDPAFLADGPHSQPATPNPVSGTADTSVGAILSGLAEGTKYYYRLMAHNVGGDAVPSAAKNFTTLALPVVSGLDATPVGATSATFLATVDPMGSGTNVVFEYGLKNVDFSHSVTPTPATLTAGGQTQAAVTGLDPLTDYQFRVRAVNVGGTAPFATFNFTTKAAADVTTGVAVTSLAGVKMTGTVNGHGLNTTVFFDYGLRTEGFPHSVPADQVAVTSNAPASVTVTVPVSADMPLGQDFHFRVRAENIATVPGDAVDFSMPANQVPVAAEVDVFFAGQVIFDPVAQCTDADNGDSALLTLDADYFTANNAVEKAQPLGDGRRVTYKASANSPRLIDVLTYRVNDPHAGVSAPASVYLTNFVNYAGSRQGLIESLPSAVRGGSVGVLLDVVGGLTGNFTWQGESYSLRGVFPADGRFRQVFAKRDHAGVMLVLSLTLAPLRTDADVAKVTGVLQETTAANPNGTATPEFELRPLGGLVRPGTRTAFIAPPSVAVDVSRHPISIGGDGYVIMSVGKSGRARLVGRLPDGHPFMTSLSPTGQTYGPLFDPYSQGQHGQVQGQLSAYDNGDDPGTFSAQLHWVKNPNAKAHYYPNGIGDFQSTLELFIADGLSYPKLGKGDLDQLGLSPTPGNAVLRLAGGNLPAGNYDVPLTITAGNVAVTGSPSGFGITSKLKLKLNLTGATFAGSFLHPGTSKIVKFNGTLRIFDGAEPDFGRGVFLGSDQSGSVRLRPAP